MEDIWVGRFFGLFNTRWSHYYLFTLQNIPLFLSWMRWRSRHSNSHFLSESATSKPSLNVHLSCVFEDLVRKMHLFLVFLGYTTLKSPHFMFELIFESVLNHLLLSRLEANFEYRIIFPCLTINYYCNSSRIKNKVEPWHLPSFDVLS